MNSQKIYDQIIERAKSRNLEGYVEKHHIIPKCLNGLNNIENIVILTAREHFLCHLLLCEIYPENGKLKQALFLMSIGKQKQAKNNYIVNNRMYERLRLEYSLFLTGKKQSNKTREKKSKTMLNVWENKTKEEKSEIGNKRWQTRIKNGTNFCSKEQAKNISKALIGRDNSKANISRSRIVEQYTLNDEFIQEFKSANEADRIMGGKGQNVMGCCNGKRQKTAYGFKWKYKK